MLINSIAVLVLVAVFIPNAHGIFCTSTSQGKFRMMRIGHRYTDGNCVERICLGNGWLFPFKQGCRHPLASSECMKRNETYFNAVRCTKYTCNSQGDIEMEITGCYDKVSRTCIDKTKDTIDIENCQILSCEKLHDRLYRVQSRKWPECQRNGKCYRLDECLVEGNQKYVCKKQWHRTRWFLGYLMVTATDDDKYECQRNGKCYRLGHCVKENNTTFACKKQWYLQDKRWQEKYLMVNVTGEKVSRYCEKVF